MTDELLGRYAEALNRRRLHFLTFLFFALLLVAAEAFAGPNVLRAGREKDVLALFAPYGLGTPVASEWKLWSVSIEAQKIVVELRAPSGGVERFTLVHPDDAPANAKRSASFALVHAVSTDLAQNKAVEQLFEAVTIHDTGGFWDTPQKDVHAEPKNPGARPSPREVSATAISSFAVDGIVGILLIWALATLLALRILRDAPRWMRFVLPAIVLLGIVVRLELSQPALLGAWPWSRLWPNVGAVYDGPVLQRLAAKFGQTFYLTDVMGWTNFAYASVMPLVLFAHGTYLLRNPRAGLAAAFMVALLPQHIRFSRCEDAFVPSLVLTSLAFALIHAWLRDPSPKVRGLVLAALPFVLYPGYLLRPLNILFIAVYLAAIAVLHPESAPRNRRIVGFAVVAGVGLLAIPSFVSKNETALGVAFSDLSWIARTFDVLLTPHLLVLTDVRVTPLVLPVMAIAGAVGAWRAGEKRLVLFLSGWLLLFVTMHAFVVEPEMEPRYHLHLVVPFLLLGAAGVSHHLSRAPRTRVGYGVAAVALLAAPWMHRHWIRDLHYSEMQEYAFVRKARDIVPEGCSVIEYVGTDERALELRFRRIGERVDAEGRANRFDVTPAFAEGIRGEATKTVEDVWRAKPACAYVYHGLACATDPADGACTAFRQRISAQVVDQVEIPIALYDRRSAARAPPPGTLVSLTLLRIDNPPKP